MKRGTLREEEADEPGEDAVLEAELARLQRSYRVMQNDYKAYKEENKRKINRQNSLINSLEKEREELDTNLSKMETTQNRCKDEANAKKLSSLCKTEKDYLGLIKEEKDKIKSLDRQISVMEEKIAQQRKKMGGIHKSTAKHIALQKKKAVLENRLYKATVLFNKQLAINSNLRSDIDHLRQERVVFDTLYKRLARELEHSKKEMAEVIEVSSKAFEQRDEAQSKITALKERTEKDQQLHDAEMKDLLRQISHDDKIKQFMQIKGNDRAELKAEEIAKKNRRDGQKGLDADKATIRSYEDAFSRIQDVTQEQDLNIIVENFIKREEQNFALFNYVTELNAEVEMLQEQVGLVKDDINKFQGEDAQIDKQRQLMMKHLEDGYEKTHQETQHAEKKLTEINKVMDTLRGGVQLMFQKLGCDPKPIYDMLGGDAGVTNKYIMMYMGLIEQKTTELLNVMYFNKVKRSMLEGVPVPPPEVGPTAQGPAMPNIVPPSTGEDEEQVSEEEEEGFPLSVEEVRAKVMRGIEKKTAMAMQLGAQKATADNKEKQKRKRGKGGPSASN